MKVKIVLVEDDADLYNLLRYAFEQEGFEFSGAQTGRDAVDLCRRRQPDLIVLDVMLPGVDGFDICKQIRRDSRLRNTPIIFLTARNRESDRVRGLEIGGNDYVVKPFSVRELMMRVKVRLREAGVRGEMLSMGAITLDRDRREVAVHGKPVSLTATEFRLLERLISAPGRVFEREELLDAVWGPACNVTDRTVDVHVRRLRKKLEPDPSNPQFIHALRGFGYTLRESA